MAGHVAAAAHLHAPLLPSLQPPIQHRFQAIATAVFDPQNFPCFCSPMFVLPVFKGPNAFENFMVQCQLPLVLFTTLEEYKL